MAHMHNLGDAPITGMHFVELFRKVEGTHKFPNIKYKLDPPIETVDTIKIYPAKYKEVLVINDNKAYPLSTRIAEIDKRNGKINWFTNIRQLKDIVENICIDPVDRAGMNGKRFNICCFCGIELTDPRSVHHGYGPICAQKWGLPWDVIDSKVEDIELDIPDMTVKTALPDGEPQPPQHGLKWNNFSDEELVSLEDSILRGNGDDNLYNEITEEIRWRKWKPGAVKTLQECEPKPPEFKKLASNVVTQVSATTPAILLDKKVSPVVEGKNGFVKIPLIKK